MTIDFELLDAAIRDAEAEANGIHHRQGTWLSPFKYDPETDQPCGTAMCLAGRMAILAGAAMPPDPEDAWYLDEATGEWVDFTEHTGSMVHVGTFARRRAGLTEGQADALFAGANTLPQIRAMVDYLREHPDASFVDVYEGSAAPHATAAAGPGD